MNTRKASNRMLIDVSVRAGSTSSRAFIFDYALAQGHVLLKIEALLPSEGAHVEPLKDKAAQQPDHFSSIAGRGVATREPSNPSRDHLVWSSLESAAGSDDSLPRPVHRSLLTGRLLECGSHKRPRKATVCIRLNGSILTTSDQTLSDDAIEHALDAALAYPHLPDLGNQQCSLDRNAFIANVQRDRFDSANNDCLIRIQTPFSVSLTTKLRISLPVLTVEPPQMDCMLCEDGQIAVACTSNGRLYTSPPLDVSENGEACTSLCAVLDVSAIDSNSCSVCWSSGGPGTVLGLSSLVKCHGCGVPVHRSCYGKPILGRSWMCDVCADCNASDPPPLRDGPAARRGHYTHHRWNVQCVSCKLTGGTFTRLPNFTYIHEVCRTWAPAVSDEGNYCALCGEGSGPVLQCMAEHCQVMFHPMCALIASNASIWKQRNSKHPPDETPLQSAMDDDDFHCTQFRLAKLDVGSLEWGDTSLVPVGLCGYHNPDRRSDLYGLYPRGQFLENAMRIPPRSVADDVQADN